MPLKANILQTAKFNTKAIYERQARYWDKIRDRSLYEKAWLDRFLHTLPSHGRLLDIGCGSGVSVSEYCINQGFDLVGIDYSKTMIELARQKFPKSRWHVQDMTAMEIDGSFDGIYSWDGFFHLSIKEQRLLIPKISEQLRSGGAILLTVGTNEGEVTGTVGGETVYHASLSPDEYEQLLRNNGFQDITFVPEDPTCNGRTVLMALNKEAI